MELEEFGKKTEQPQQNGLIGFETDEMPGIYRPLGYRHSPPPDFEQATRYRLRVSQQATPSAPHEESRLSSLKFWKKRHINYPLVSVIAVTVFMSAVAIILATVLSSKLRQLEDEIQAHTGPPGQKGDRGIQGMAGPSGGKGNIGMKGNIGPVGATGPIYGPQGPRGENGATGATGLKGEVGVKGHLRDKGTKGHIGPVGATGPLGGPPGLKGEIGPVGATGASGEKGQKGYGATGTKGQKGEKGDKGPVFMFSRWYY